MVVFDYGGEYAPETEFDKLLALNPEFKAFLDSVHREGHQYRHICAVLAGMISTEEFPDKGGSIGQQILYFYNTTKSIEKTVEEEKYHYIKPHNGDHLVGALLRKVGKDLVQAVGEKKEVVLEHIGMSALGEYKPTMSFTVANAEAQRGEENVLEGKVAIPLSVLQSSIDIQEFVGKINEALVSYVKEQCIPALKLQECAEIKEKCLLDLSGIVDKGIDIGELIKTKSTAQLDKERIVISYHVWPSLAHRRSIEERAMWTEGVKDSTLKMLSEGFGLKYQVVEKWAFPENNEYTCQKQERIAAGEMTLDDIREHVLKQARNALENELRAVYEQKLEQAIQKADQNNASDLFGLGILYLISDRKKCADCINKSIELGLLEQEVPQKGLIGVIAVAMGETLKNTNPLHYYNDKVKWSF